MRCTTVLRSACPERSEGTARSATPRCGIYQRPTSYLLTTTHSCTLVKTCIRLLLVGFLIVTFSENLRAQAPSSGRIVGTVFGDTYLKVSGEQEPWGSNQYADEPSDRFGVKLRRIQLGYEYRFDQRFSGKVLLETIDTPDLQDLPGDVFVKEAYLTWHNVLGDLQMGVVTTPLFRYVENAWEYRAIEKDILTIYSGESATALGVSLDGSVGERVGYHVMVGSYGAGTALYGSTNVQLGGGVHTEVMLGMLPREDSDPLYAGRLFLGLDRDWGKLGVSTTATSEVAGDKTATRLMASAYAVIPVSRGSLPTSLFARYDYFDPDLDFSETALYDDPENFYRQHLMIAGVDMQVHPQISIMPNVWVNAYAPRTDNYPSRDADAVVRMTVRFAFP